MHVNGFGALLFDSVIGNTSCCDVVSLDWRRGGCGCPSSSRLAGGRLLYHCGRGIDSGSDSAALE